MSHIGGLLEYRALRDAVSPETKADKPLGIPPLPQTQADESSDAKKTQVYMYVYVDRSIDRSIDR